MIRCLCAVCFTRVKAVNNNATSSRLVTTIPFLFFFFFLRRWITFSFWHEAATERNKTLINGVDAGETYWMYSLDTLTPWSVNAKEDDRIVINVQHRKHNQHVVHHIPVSCILLVFCLVFSFSFSGYTHDGPTFERKLSQPLNWHRYRWIQRLNPGTSITLWM